jgi:hypothetical protein
MAVLALIVRLTDGMYPVAFAMIFLLANAKNLSTGEVIKKRGSSKV